LRRPRDTLYPQKLALTSPTSGGRSAGIVRLQTKAMEISFLVLVLWPQTRSLGPVVVRRFRSLTNVGYLKHLSRYAILRGLLDAVKSCRPDPFCSVMLQYAPPRPGGGSEVLIQEGQHLHGIIEYTCTGEEIPV
jgi:hypothetical protein